jgi:hypothetical protein
MSHTHQPTLALNFGLPRGGALREWADRALASLQSRLALARARATVLALDAAHLADAGIDAAAILPARPTIVVEAGLMSRLMTMQ